MNKQENGRQVANLERWLAQLDSRLDIQLEALNERQRELEKTAERLDKGLDTVFVMGLVSVLLALLAIGAVLEKVVI